MHVTLVKIIKVNANKKSPSKYIISDKNQQILNLAISLWQYITKST